MQGSAICCHDHFDVVSDVNNCVITTPAANNGHDDVTVLFQVQNGNRHIIAFYSAIIPDAASCYTSTELELCGLKKSLLYFQNLLK